jgi:hypothetical protein
MSIGVDRAHVVGRDIEAIIALILLAAAILKAHQLFNNSASLVPSLIRHKPILLALIQSELILAAWLLIGGFPVPASSAPPPPSPSSPPSRVTRLFTPCHPAAASVV